jgi:hypothetical protein
LTWIEYRLHLPKSFPNQARRKSRTVLCVQTAIPRVERAELPIAIMTALQVAGKAHLFAPFQTSPGIVV